MSQSDDDTKRMILERRARFIAAALSASGLVACGAKSADNSAGSGDGLVDMPTSPTGGSEMNPIVPSRPTVCLSIEDPSIRPAPLPTNPNPFPTSPTGCLAMLPDPTVQTAPTIQVPTPASAAGAGGAPPESAGAGGAGGVGVSPQPTVCLRICLGMTPIDEPDPTRAPVILDAGASADDGGTDASTDGG